MFGLRTMRRDSGFARWVGAAPLTLLLVASLPIVGCSRSAERQSRARSGPEAMSQASEIAHARCRREVHCGNVGNDQLFSSHTQCVRELSQQRAEDLSQAACPANIDPVRLDNCLRSIASEECNSPLAILERSVDCRTSALCRER